MAIRVFVAAAAAAVVGGVGIVKLATVDEVGGGIYENNLLPINTLAQIDGDVNEIRATILRHVISTDPEEMRKRDAEITDFRAELDAEWKQYTAAGGSAQEQAAREQFTAALAAMYTIADDELLPHSRNNETAQAAEAEVQNFDPAFDKVGEALAALAGAEMAQAEAGAGEAEATYLSARTRMVVILVLGLVLALVIGVFVARSVSRPLGCVVAVLRRVEQGDLTAFAEVHSRDEIGQLSTALNSTTTRLRQVIGEQMAHTALGKGFVVVAGEVKELAQPA